MDFNRKIDHNQYGDTDLPTYPARTLAAHVATKGMQVGSMFGMLFATPSLMWLKGKPFCSAWAVALPASATVGTCIAFCMLYHKHVKGALTDEGVDDRAYRIHHNIDQRKLGKYSAVGAVAGMCSVILWRRSRFTLATSATGVAAGVFLFVGEKIMYPFTKSISV